MLDLFFVSIPLIYIHLGALLCAAVVVAIADHEALSWLRGKKETLSLKRLRILHAAVWVALIVLIASGAAMAWGMLTYLTGTAAFWIKMFFVLVLVVNSFFIGACMNVAAEKPFVALSKNERVPLFVSGAASAIGWVGAFVSALFMSTTGWLALFLSRMFG